MTFKTTPAGPIVRLNAQRKAVDAYIKNNGQCKPVHESK